MCHLDLKNRPQLANQHAQTILWSQPGQLMSRRYLSDRSRLANRYSHTRLTTLSTAISNRQFWFTLFRRTLAHRRAQVDRTWVGDKNVPCKWEQPNFCRTLRQWSTHSLLARSSSPSPIPLPRGSLGHYRWIHNQFPPFFSVLQCPLGPGEPQACQFPDVVFPPLPLSEVVLFPLSLCLVRRFWSDLVNGRHDHTTAVCVSLRWPGCLPRPIACWILARTWRDALIYILRLLDIHSPVGVLYAPPKAHAFALLFMFISLYHQTLSPVFAARLEDKQQHWTRDEPMTGHAVLNSRRWMSR